MVWHIFAFILMIIIQFSSVTNVRLFATSWTAARQASLSITNSQSLLKLMSIGSVMPSSYLILCRPLLSPWIFPSLRVFFNESVLGTEKASFTDMFYLLFLERRGEIRMAFSYLLFFKVPFSSVQFSCSVVSDCLRPCGLQHARPPYLSPTPRTCSNLCPLSPWYPPTISSSVVPFSSCLQSFPASGSSPISQFFTSGGQSIGVSASASVLRMNTRDWFPLGLYDTLEWVSNV